MPKRLSTPQPTKHKTGQAVVRLNGRDHYLGRYGTPEAKQNYDALIARWLANGRQLPDDSANMTVNEVILAYLRWAAQYYRPRRRRDVPTIDGVKQISQILRPLYGREAAITFGPKALKVIRKQMVQRGWSRNYINLQIARLKRLFKWAVAEEMIPASVYHALQTVPALRKGEMGVRETEAIKPATQSTVEAAIPHMPPPVAAMVRLQMLTGMRPGEVVMMRKADIDTSGAVWIYRPPHHKTERHGQSREIYLGPKAQDVLAPWVMCDDHEYLFSPARAEEARNAQRRKQRQTKMTRSQSRRQKKANPKRPRRDCYDVGSYRQAITRACDRAFPPPEPLVQRPGESAKERNARLTESQRAELRVWQRKHHFHPNQLRHLAATLIRKERGVELARIVLGHSTAFTTEIYAEADRTQAIELMSEVG